MVIDTLSGEIPLLNLILYPFLKGSTLKGMVFLKAITKPPMLSQRTEYQPSVSSLVFLSRL